MNVRDLGKLIVAKGFKSCPKSNKSPNLVTLDVIFRVITNTDSSSEVIFFADNRAG